MSKNTQAEGNHAAFGRPDAPARMFGAAERMVAGREEIDRTEAAFQAGGGTLASFVRSEGRDCGVVARELVAAHILGRDDPVAVAMQGVAGQGDRVSRVVGEMKTGRALGSVDAMAGEVLDAGVSQGERQRLVAMRRAARNGHMTGEKASESFEAIARTAAGAGRATTAAQAGEACAITTQASVQAAREKAPRMADRDDVL